MMHKWLGRFAFSFIIIAAVLIWESNRASRPMDPTRRRVYEVTAGVLIVLAVLGVRARHGGEN